MMPNSFIEHLELHLGPIEKRFTRSEGGNPRGFQLLRFGGSPFPEAATIVTAGLGGHVLRQDGGRNIRQELVMCSYRSSADARLAALLEVVARSLLERHAPLPRGQVLGPSGPIVEGSTLEALVCASPWYWDDALSCYDGIDPSVLLVWLVPVTLGEASYVRTAGIDAFEALLSDEEPDLLDLAREEIRGLPSPL